MQEETLKQKTAKGLLWGGMNNGIMQILNLVFGIVLGRLLAPSDYGMIGALLIFWFVLQSQRCLIVVVIYVLRILRVQPLYSS